MRRSIERRPARLEMKSLEQGASRQLAPPYNGRDRPATETYRSVIVLKSLHWIVLAALVAAGATYAISRAIPATYRSSASIRVQAQPVNGVSDAVTASDTLASQYAELVTTPAVLDPAAAALHLSSSTLGAAISAGTEDAQNVVSISADAPEASGAASRANTVAKRFIAFLNETNGRQASDLAAEISGQLGTGEAGGEAAIKSAQSEVSNDTAAVLHAYPSNRAARVAALNAAENELPSLISARQALLLSIAQDSAAARPSLQQLGAAGSGDRVVPKPTLYAAIAFVVALLAAAQLFVVFRRPPPV
jgi:hypothetical protein